MTPLESLAAGCWFKLICGASYQDLPAVRNLALAYALAGADCIDVAADPAVIAAARSGIDAAVGFVKAARDRGFEPAAQPFLMASFNDGEDPHFRKATFDPATCPRDCPRPCLRICPAGAIAPTGVDEPRCYGCGRCLPICPHEKIAARTHQLSPAEVMTFLAMTDAATQIDAVEIHTQPGRIAEFSRLWTAIAPAYDARAGRPLRLLAVSCPDGSDLIDYQQKLYGLIRDHWSGPLVWQTDGRPMSGDIGIGTTRASVRLARKVAASGPPGYVQLAGGTNQHTVSKLRLQGLLATPRRPSASRSVAGVAYGSYARALLAPILARLTEFEVAANEGRAHDGGPLEAGPDGALVPLETVPELLWQAVATAAALVSPLKAFQTTCTA